MTAKATLAKAMSESDLQAAVIQLAQLKGWLAHHTRPAFNQSGKWATPIQGNAGFPDICLARKGVVLFFELKREKEKLEPNQELWREALGLGRAFVFKPSQWQDGTIARFLE